MHDAGRFRASLENIGDGVRRFGGLEELLLCLLRPQNPLAEEELGRICCVGGLQFTLQESETGAAEKPRLGDLRIIGRVR